MTRNKQLNTIRTLDADVPELKDYLRPGINVLDVGCGSQSIILDVAAAVHPGKVVGIDPNEGRIEEAQAWAAEAYGGENITFQKGDTHALDFPDQHFDVVYSHTVLHFVIDPVSALKEQKRITKNGGWIAASGVRDTMSLPRYPACPSWEKALTAFSRYQQSVLDTVRQSGLDAEGYMERHCEDNPTAMVYYDLSAGRKVPEWFVAAGLADFRLCVKAEHLQHFGSDYMNPSPWDVVLLDEPQNDGQSQFALWWERMIAKGYITKDTLANACEEARAWYHDPRAFNFWTLVFAAAQVSHSAATVAK